MSLRWAHMPFCWGLIDFSAPDKYFVVACPPDKSGDSDVSTKVVFLFLNQNCRYVSDCRSRKKIDVYWLRVQIQGSRVRSWPSPVFRGD